MKEQFLGHLKNKLFLLSKKECNRYLENFREIIEDKIETGVTEECAVLELEPVEVIASDIINTYTNEEKRSLLWEFQLINKKYILCDAVIMILSYLLMLFLYKQWFLSDQGMQLVSYTYYISRLFFVLPLYLILYFALSLYTVNCISKISMWVRSIVFANMIGVLLLGMLLWVFNLMYFSRRFLLFFAAANLLLELIARFALYCHANR